MAKLGTGKQWFIRSSSSRICFALWLGCLLLLGGCSWVAQVSENLRLRGLDSDIRNATEAIAKTTDGSQRAKAYSARGSAYAEKARYSRAFKLIPTDQYERLFALAVEDHHQAIAIDPGSAEAYFKLGEAYWDRGTSEMADHKDSKTWFDHAAEDFKIATERDPQNSMAFDLLGLSHEQNGEWDQAIQDYSREQMLNPRLGTAGLTGAYCGRGQQHQVQNNNQAAIADYEKSIGLGATSEDGCSCEPYNPLLMLYTQTGQYEKAWEFVRWAQKSNHPLSGELVNQLKTSSGRSS